MVGMRFAEAGMLGRRNSTADVGLVSEFGGEVVLMGDSLPLCVGEGTGGGARFGTRAGVVALFVERLDKFASPGKAIAPGD
jgi:hypothetical protein